MDHHPSLSPFFLLRLKRLHRNLSKSPFLVSPPRFKPSFHAHQLENLGTALTVINTFLTDPSCQEILIRNTSTHRSTSVSLKDIITLESVARGIKETKWPGRLSFHTVDLPSSPATPNEAPPPPFLVLADGAHNPASAKTLGDYITHLLHQTIISATTTKENPNYQATRPKPFCINFNITYILSLSHSPPKTPFQTLSPLFQPLGSTIEFGDIEASMTISVGLLRFTPPEGMPWIKCVPPSEVEEVVISYINVWVVPEADIGTKVVDGSPLKRK